MKPIYLDYNLSSIANRRTSQHCDGKNIASLKEVNIELKELAATDRRHEHLPTLRVYYTPEKYTVAFYCEWNSFPSILHDNCLSLNMYERRCWRLIISYSDWRTPLVAFVAFSVILAPSKTPWLNHLLTLPKYHISCFVCSSLHCYWYCYYQSIPSVGGCVCRFVCLPAQLFKKLWTKFYELLWKVWLGTRNTC